MAYNSAAYCSGDLGPGNIQNRISDIQGSGLTTAILWAVHIGRPEISGQKYGDLIFNNYPDDLFVSAGKFDPNDVSTIAAWPGQVAQLKQNSSVSKIFFSIGGWGVKDFETIQFMLNNGMSDKLTANLKALQTAFTVNGTCVIDGFDLDCEEYVDQSTIVGFCRIVFGLGFAVTFCPYMNQEFWQGSMQTLWNDGHKVSWWNLQCYAGGGGNRTDLSPWIAALAAVVGKEAAPSYLVPGLAVAGSESDGQCPTGQDSICTTFAGWSGLGLPGGFLWMYDSIVANPGACGGQANLASYVSAINNGLSNNC